MKCIYLVILLYLFQSCSNNDKSNIKRSKNISQKLNKSQIDNDTNIYNIVEEMPILKDCEYEINKKQCSDRKLLNYIYKNIKYEKFSSEEAIESTTVISFVIEKNGEISNTKIVKGNPNSNIDEVIMNMPEWVPGKQNNKVKRVEMKLPLRVCFR